MTKDIEKKRPPYHTYFNPTPTEIEFNQAASSYHWENDTTFRTKQIETFSEFYATPQRPTNNKQPLTTIVKKANSGYVTLVEVQEQIASKKIESKKKSPEKKVAASKKIRDIMRTVKQQALLNQTSSSTLTTTSLESPIR